MNTNRLAAWALAVCAAGSGGSAIADPGRYAYTPSPIFGFDPSLGFIYGGALFVHPESSASADVPSRYFDIQLMTIDRPVGKLITTWRQSSPAGGGWGLEATVSDFFENYYGEGAVTSAEPLSEVDQRSIGLTAEWSRSLAGAVDGVLFLDHRSRQEHAVDGNSAVRLFPDESGTAPGVGLRLDSRNNSFTATAGRFAELRLRYLPKALTSVATAAGTAQLEGEYRGYFSRGSLAYALRLAGGVSSGTPSYLFRYRLGGASALRGYQSNRLRGDHYWVVQQELRYPIWRFVSGTGFHEFGSAGDSAAEMPVRSTSGLGLRFGIPPTYDVKLRFDLGFVPGEGRRLFFTFGQVY